jgi:hypothetical protein
MCWPVRRVVLGSSMRGRGAGISMGRPFSRRSQQHASRKHTFGSRWHSGRWRCLPSLLSARPFLVTTWPKRLCTSCVGSGLGLMLPIGPHRPCWRSNIAGTTEASRSVGYLQSLMGGLVVGDDRHQRVFFVGSCWFARLQQFEHSSNEWGTLIREAARVHKCVPLTTQK